MVTVAVYSYFLAGLFGNQFLEPTLYRNEDINGTMQLNPVRETNISGETWGPPYYTAGKRLGLQDVVGYGDVVDFYIPMFTILEFIFYDGWLRVAGALLNPFGEDDDDFDVNYIIDRNITMGYIMVEEEDVDLEPDTFGEDNLPPIELPHTERSVRDGSFGRRSYKKKKSQPTFSRDSSVKSGLNGKDHLVLQM